ncbi:Ppx/GppA phosphatase family protein [Rhodococcus ruber]|uniref:Ppx/GppA phosphatase family protein n=1 Tax=Rhodococcus TaxID=1827 RepID=UPI000EB68DAA|nr:MULTISPECIES: hypothetical protein [Rhodococcus]AXY53875.1 Ppx/GppA phosphatase [Rhodococcus ruber]WML61867.1 hypothetical protein QNA09_18675 [Rhodococcus sp. AH-ZY2]
MSISHSMVAIGGKPHASEQLARLTGGAPQRRGPFVRRTLHRSDVHRWAGRLTQLPTRERARLLRGISPARARQIPAGAIVADEAMRALDVDLLDVSPWALREGVMLQHLATVTAPDVALPLQPLVPAEPEKAQLVSLPTEASKRTGFA